MLKILHGYLGRKIAVRVLYCLVFAGLAPAGAGYEITHWIARTEGPKILAMCLVGYIAIIASLIWALNRANRAFPDLVLPPADSISSPVFDAQELSSSDSESMKAGSRTGQYRK